MSLRPFTVAAASTLLCALALFACSNESSPSKHAPAAKVVRAQLPPAAERNAPPPKPAPPPLIEAKEPEDGKLDVFVPIIPEKRAPKAPVETVEKENVFWRYTDQNGVSHITDDQSNIPKAFRGSAEKVERLPARPPSYSGGSASEVMDQTGEGATGGSVWQKREKACEAYRGKVKEARDRLSAASEAYALAQNSPPECGPQVVPGLNTTFDADCESHWKARVELLRKNEERAQNALRALQDEARRADVPPGCLR